jgi:hypothetical protein
MRTRLNEFRNDVKNSITGCLVAIYLKHNGSLPDWSNDEEFVIDDDELGRSIRISMEVSNTYSEDTLVEKWVINQFRVTCDNNLFFECEGCTNEVEWTEVSTDELVGILEILIKFCEKILK